jgi:hypothetical protein
MKASEAQGLDALKPVVEVRATALNEAALNQEIGP